MMDILTKIVNKRIEEIAKKGYTLGVKVPKKREVPIIPFITPPFVITEVKRSSPSRGKIKKIKDPAKQASLYLQSGSKHISVLTEENFFNGSLEDLIQIKREFPHASILRKDFLLEIEDIEITYKAGADALLLIASILTKEKFRELYLKTVELGLIALVEVHTKEDLEKIRALKPRLTGINCRNLKTFKTDLIHPIRIKNLIDWETIVVFESGIHSKEDATFAFSAGFDAILTGESVVRNPALVARFLEVANNHTKRNFFSSLYKLKKEHRPLVKICGITNKEDAENAVKLGADILGFIFAPSPRETDGEFVESIKDLKVLKVAVTVDLHKNLELQKELKKLYKIRAIDIIQYHGDEPVEFCTCFGLPYYKALRPKNSTDFNEIDEFRSPRILLDAFSEKSVGGTGKLIDSSILEQYDNPLWLAGGINPNNVEEIIAKWKPELIDLSSGVEQTPGEKDYKKLQHLFKNIDKAENSQKERSNE